MSQRETIEDILDANTISILRSVTGGSCVLVDPEGVYFTAKPISKAVELALVDAVLLAKLLLDVESWSFSFRFSLPDDIKCIINLNSPSGSVKLMIDIELRRWDFLCDRKTIGGFFDPVAGKVRDILKRTFPDIASSDKRSMWKAGAIARLKQLADEDGI